MISLEGPFVSKECVEELVDYGKFVTYTSSQPKELLITTTPNKDKIRTNDGKTTFEYRTLTSDNELTSEEEPRYVACVFTVLENFDDYDRPAAFYYPSEYLSWKKYVTDPDNDQIVLKHFSGETFDGDWEVLSPVVCVRKTDDIIKRATNTLCSTRDPESEVYIFVFMEKKYQRHYLGQFMDMNDGDVVKCVMISSALFV